MIYKIGQILTLKSNNKVKYVIKKITNFEFVANGKQTKILIESSKGPKLILSLEQMDIFFTDQEIRKIKLDNLKNEKVSI